MGSVSLKTCARCKDTKPTAEFGRAKSAKDGLNHYCRSCWNAMHRKRREENREHDKACQRSRYQENIEFKRAQNKAYRAKNPEEARRKEREYYAKTKERRREQAREKYRRNIENDEWREREYARVGYLGRQRYEECGSPSQETYEYAATLRRDPCGYCGASPAGEIDHILPLTQGGLHEMGNLTAACRSCNASKQNKGLLGFLLYRLEE